VCGRSLFFLPRAENIENLKFGKGFDKANLTRPNLGARLLETPDGCVLSNSGRQRSRF
jgi:hypothetical protein